MDKIKYINSKPKKQQGFALMITLSVLSVIIALTMVLLSYFEEVQEDAQNTKALIQADIYYTDIVSLFNSLPDKYKKDFFPILYKIPLPLTTEDNEFSLVLHCNSLSRGVNINWLGRENSGQEKVLWLMAQELLEELAQKYDIEDIGRLQEMLRQEMVGKAHFIQKEQSRLLQKKGIISYNQFKDIVSRYQFEVDDATINNIPWQKYFSFSPQVEKVDGEYSSPELISYLFAIELSAVQEWASYVDRGDLESFVNGNGGNYKKRESILAGKVFLDTTECLVDYALSKEQYRFKFEYIQGEAKHFEFYGKQ